jgi:hypothetical protein
MLGKDLVIEYKSSVKPRVEGSVNYTVLDDRVIVYNYNNQYFRLIFGYSSDVYEFGATTALLGEFAEERKIEIELQDYIDRYLNWTFTEIDSAHWYANFTFNTTVYNDIKACYNKKCTDKCWASIQANYFPDYDVSKVCNDIKNITNYPYQNLTEGVKIDKIKIDTNTGTGSFYLTFPHGFRKGEKMKFGFDSTIVSTTTTTPFNPNQRAICRDGKNYIHVVWLYNSTVIKYARSTDNGASFSVIDLNTSSDMKTTPHISCNGNYISVGYSSAGIVVLKLSSDYGSTWSFVSTGKSGSDVSVERDGQNIYVVYTYPRSTYFTKSTDAGATWSTPTELFHGYLLDYPDCISVTFSSPSFVRDGNTLRVSAIDSYVVYELNLLKRTCTSTVTSTYGIYFINSTDAGSTWINSTVVPEGSIDFITLSLTQNYTNTSNVYLTTLNTNFVYFTNSTNNGANWTALYPINTTTYTKFYPSMGVMSNGNPIVFWYESNGVNDWIVSRNFTNAWGDLVYLTPTTGSYRYPNSKYNFTGNCIEYVYLNRTIAPDGHVYCNATYPCYVQYKNIGTCSAPIVDTTPPTYSLNSTNSTLAGTAVIHNLYWQDDYGLSYAIFSFDNCTGSLQNITGMSLSGASAWSNFTVTINSTVGCTIRWCVYANDTSNNWNGTSCLQPFSYTTTSAAVPQVYERNLSISFTQSVSTARSVNMQRDFSQYVYLPVQFGRYATVGRTGKISISTIIEFLRNTLYTRDFSTSTSIVAELLRNTGYTRETSTSISALVEFFKLIKPLDYCFEIRRDGNTVTCVKDKVSQVNCLDITDINNWIYICELADRMLMVIKL